MHHVDKYGIGKVVEMALEHVGQDRPIHLSFDVGAWNSSLPFLSFFLGSQASRRADVDRDGLPVQTRLTRLLRRVPELP